jgi:trigger factor
MNIEQKQSDDLSITLSLTIEQSDYGDRVQKSLQEFRRNTEIRGFRKGMVPMSLIQKMQGRSALLEEVNKLMSEGLNEYIKEQQIKIIGEPLPNDELQKPIDWERDKNFTFIFDLMLAPKVALILGSDDRIPLIEKEITQADRDRYVDSFFKQH